VRALHDTPEFAASVDEAGLLAILAAALLHDLGHYPFAHSLEALHHKGRDTPRHEDLAGRLIRGEFAAVQRHEKPIAHLLRWDWGIDPEHVIRLITAKKSALEPSARALQSIISGAIDADKMDYMERDSVHLGVEYGRNYDRDRLLGALTLNEAGDALAVWAKGKLSAEIFVFCRYAMFSEVYWHHTVRSASCMVEGALADLVERRGESADNLANELLVRSDEELLVWFRSLSEAGTPTERLLSGLTGDRRKLYKRLVTYSPSYAETHKQQAYERLYRASPEDTHDIVARIRVRLEGLVGHALHPSAVLVDVPPRDKDKLEPFVVRFPNASGQREYPLHTLSGIVSGVQSDMIQVVKKIRIFVEPTVVAELRGQRTRVEDACLREILAPGRPHG
jgi:HD superfamily phosphohydrolase